MECELRLHRAERVYLLIKVTKSNEIEQKLVIRGSHENITYDAYGSDEKM